MDISTRLKHAMDLNSAVRSGAELARRAKMNPVTVRAYLAGERNPPLNACNEIGAVLGVRGQWLFDGKGPKFSDVTDSTSTSIPVMGRIGAGAEIDAGVEQVPPEGYYDIEATLSLPSGSIGFEVIGESMYPRYYAGDIIVCHRDGTPFRDIPNGAEAALLTGDGRRFVKQMFKTETQNVYDLVSYNASLMRSTPIVWAALILVIIPASQWVRVTEGERQRLYREAARMKRLG